MSRREDRWEGRYDRAADAFTDHPLRAALKWFAAICAGVLVLGAISSVFGWVSLWGGEAKRITSPANVREQNTAVIDDWEAMQAAAANACQARRAASANGDPTLVEDPALAYAAQYRHITVDYNRRMANLYEAQAVRNLPLPSNLRDYPRRAPTLEQLQRRVC